MPERHVALLICPSWHNPQLLESLTTVALDTAWAQWVLSCDSSYPCYGYTCNSPSLTHCQHVQTRSPVTRGGKQLKQLCAKHLDGVPWDDQTGYGASLLLDNDAALNLLYASLFTFCPHYVWSKPSCFISLTHLFVSFVSETVFGGQKNLAW